MNFSRSWDRPAVMALIDIYERNPCLYDVQSPDYHNRNKNRDIVEEMVRAVAQFHPSVTAADCKKKYQGLRGQFLTECRKVADSKKSGAGTSSVYIPKLWCFDALRFLRDYIKVRPSTYVDGEDVEEVTDEEDMTVEYLDEDLDYSELSDPFPSTRLESYCTSATSINIEKRTSASSTLAAAEKDYSASARPSSASARPSSASARPSSASPRPSSATDGFERRSVPSPVPGCSKERSITPSQKKRKISDVAGSPSCAASREDTPTREVTPTGRGRLDTTAMIASAINKVANNSIKKDDYDVFANFVAARLRKLGPDYSEEVEQDIVNIIFAAERRKKYDS